MFQFLTKTTNTVILVTDQPNAQILVLRGLLEKYPTFGREKETGLLGALDT